MSRDLRLPRVLGRDLRGVRPLPNLWSVAASDEEILVDKLITALRHPEPTRARLAIHTLGEMRVEPHAILPLIDLLGTAGDIADRRASPAIGRLLLDPETPVVVRTVVVEALGRIGGAGRWAVLERALANPSAVVREGAGECCHATSTMSVRQVVNRSQLEEASLCQ